MLTDRYALPGLHKHKLLVFLALVLVIASSLPAALLRYVAAAPAVVQLPARLQAEDYRAGGEGFGYHDTSAGNYGGVYRNEDVDIEGCYDGSSCYNVGWIDTNEWLAFDVKSSATQFTFKVRAAAPYGANFHIERDGTNVTGSVAIASTGGWQTWTTVVVAAPVTFSGGNHVLKLVSETGNFNLNYIDVLGTGPTPTPTTPPPTATPTTAPPTATATTPPPTATATIPAPTATPTTPYLMDVAVSPASAPAGSYLTLSYTIQSPSAQQLSLGAGIRTSANGSASAGPWTYDGANDRTVSVPAGLSTQTRQFLIPSNESQVAHDVIWGLWSAGFGTQYAGLTRINVVTVTAPLPTATATTAAPTATATTAPPTSTPTTAPPTATATIPAPTATPTTPYLVDVAASPASAPAGSYLTLSYTIQSPSAQQLSLGAGIRTSANGSTSAGLWNYDGANDRTVSVPAGLSTQTRQFLIPSNESQVAHDIIWGLWSTGFGTQYAGLTRINVVTVVAPLPTVTATTTPPTATATQTSNGTTTTGPTMTPTATSTPTTGPTPSAPTLLGIDVNPKQANTGDTVTISYTIFSPNATQYGLGAQMGVSGQPMGVYDPGNDSIANVPAGTSTVTRFFYLSPNLKGGVYDVAAGFWNSAFVTEYGRRQLSRTLSITVVAQTPLVPAPTPAPTARTVNGATVYISQVGPAGGTVANVGSTLTLNYTINNTSNAPINVKLGASIAPSGQSGFGAITDTVNELSVSVPPGLNTRNRSFVLPATVSEGGYDVTWTLKDANNAVLDSLTTNNHLWVQSSAQTPNGGVTLLDPGGVALNTYTYAVHRDGTLNRIFGTFTVNNASGAPARLILRLRIKRAADADWIYDYMNDQMVTVPVGQSSWTRPFNVPLYTPSGTYNIAYELTTPDFSGNLDQNVADGGTGSPQRLQITNTSPIANVGVPTLMYHNINPTSAGGNWVKVTNFQQQMDYLVANGWTTVDGDAIYNYLYRGIALPAKPIWLTFDDLYQNVYDYAYPIMQARGLHASIFSVTEYMGKMSLWDLGLEPPHLHMTWAMLQQMRADGNYADGHTRRHAHLSELTPTQQYTEIWGSQRDMVAFTGTAANSFAYPYGAYNDVSEWMLAHSGFRAATVIGQEKQHTTDIRDMYTINRIGIADTDTVTTFANKINAP